MTKIEEMARASYQRSSEMAAAEVGHSQGWLSWEEMREADRHRLIEGQRAALEVLREMDAAMVEAAQVAVDPRDAVGYVAADLCFRRIIDAVLADA